MSMMSDPFDDIIAGLEIDEPADVTDFTQLPDVDLSTRYTIIKEALHGLGEMLVPHTDAARELHSERAAILIEMRKRGLV